MTEKQVNKILDNFKYSLEELLPERREQVGLLSLCLKEIFEELIYSDLTKKPAYALIYPLGLYQKTYAETAGGAIPK